MHCSVAREVGRVGRQGSRAHRGRAGPRWGHRTSRRSCPCGRGWSACRPQSGRVGGVEGLGLEGLEGAGGAVGGPMVICMRHPGVLSRAPRPAGRGCRLLEPRQALGQGGRLPPCRAGGPPEGTTCCWVRAFFHSRISSMSPKKSCGATGGHAERDERRLLTSSC